MVSASGPIFVHSSFRTGSTWLWSRFRAERRCCAYYEYYNEALATLDLASISHSNRDWNSHHPSEAPYFLEFAPLLMEAGGVRGYDAEMAFGHFFAAPAGDDEAMRAQRDYVALLIACAADRGEVPVLACTRSLGRAAWLRREFGGLHIALRRNLLHQWFSYSNQAITGNPYFLGSVLDTIDGGGADPVAAALRRFVRDNLVRPADGAAPVPGDDLFICFAVLHIYLDHLGARDADIAADLGDLAANSGGGRATLEAAIRAHGGLAIDLSGAREVVSAPMLLPDDRRRIDLTVQSLCRIAMQATGADIGPLDAIAAARMASLWEDYDRYRHQAGSAHAEIARLRALLPAGEREREILQASLAEASAYAGSLETSRSELARERDALRAALDDAGRERAGAQRIAADLGARRDEAEAARDRLSADLAGAEDRAAALAAQQDAISDRLAGMEAAFAGERRLFEANLADATAYAATLARSRDEGTTLQAEMIERLAAQDERIASLESERDDLLRRLQAGLADAVRDADSLAAARDEAVAARSEAESALHAAEARASALERDIYATRERFAAAHSLLERDRARFEAALAEAGDYARSLEEARGEAVRTAVAARQALAEAGVEADRLRAAAAEAAAERDALRERIDIERQAALRRIEALEQANAALMYEESDEGREFAERWTKMMTRLK